MKIKKSDLTNDLKMQLEKLLKNTSRSKLV